MRSRRLGALRVASGLALALGACVDAPDRSPPIVSPRAEPAPPARAPVRLFFAPSDAFWVTRGPDLDRAISTAGRFEIRPNGELVSAGWEAPRADKGSPFVGAVAVPPRLGGGFVAWSHDRVAYGPDFTGPLDPVPLDLDPDVAIRGVRPGLGAMVVFTDAGPREVEVGRVLRVRPVARPGLLDVVALDDRRAVTLDVFRRASVTRDGGATFSDLTGRVGFVRQLVAGPDEVVLDGLSGRAVVHAEEGIERRPGTDRFPGYEQLAAYQIAWKPRVAPEETAALLGVNALAAAVGAGAPVGDGTALGVIGTALVRVDLETAKLVSYTDEWVPPGLTCQAARAPDAVLFACVWDRSMGYGAYVLRSRDGGLPVLEKAFSDDGSFVGDDAGALAFAGSCSAAPRVINKSDPSRLEAEIELGPVLCVRTGPDRWEEHRIEPPAGTSVVGWAPRLDGTAAALVLPTQPLLPVRGEARRFEQGGVSVVRVFGEQAGYAWRGAPSGAFVIDKRFRAREDGTIDGWLMPSEPTGIPLGVTIDRAGDPAVHVPAPNAAEVYAIGSFAVALGRDDELYESVDHGRTWRATGRTPVPIGAGAAGGCSPLGCAVGPVVRVGWGPSPITPRVVADRPVAPLRPSAPRLACTPTGVPGLLPPPPSNRGSDRYLISSLELDALTGRSRGSVRRLFDASGGSRVFEHVDPRIDSPRNVVILLSRPGELDLLLSNDTGELLPTAGRGAVFVPFDDASRSLHRTGFGVSGLTLDDGSVLFLSSEQEGLALQTDGLHAKVPPVFLGDAPARPARPLSLAWRDDGAIAVLITDGGAGARAGVAVLDRAAGAVGPITPLAPWSTLRTADDASCKKPDPSAAHAVLFVDPRAWLSIDEAMLPGVRLGPEGLLLVRWGGERACLEGIDALVTDERGDPDHAVSILVGRWGRDGRGASLRGRSLAQGLRCALGYDDAKAAAVRAMPSSSDTRGL